MNLSPLMSSAHSPKSADAGTAGLKAEMVEVGAAQAGQRIDNFLHQLVDCFQKIPHKGFPDGAALRTPALVVAMAGQRLLDKLA